VVSRVAYARERLILTRRGRKLAAIVQIEDLEELETRRAAEATDEGANT